jgi:hypothetical protein
MRLVKTVADVLALLVFTMVSMVTYAKPTTGSCQSFEFPTASDPNVIDTAVPVRVLRQEVPVYSEASGSATMSQLDFDTDLMPIRQTANRVLVRKPSASTDLGWIEKHDLLCQVEYPLMEKGLPRKAFVNSLTKSGSFQAPVYASPDRNQCPPCKPISYLSSRFNRYFVFAADPQNRRYLLARGFVLSDGDKRFPLVGWIDAERMIPWNTNLGLRPKNDTRDPSQAQTILAYHTLEDSQKQNKHRSIELLEGNVWYTFPLHMPLLGIVDGHYHVTAPSVGMKGFKTFHQVREFYIPIQEGQMQVEVVLIERHIDRWIKLLNPLVRLGGGMCAREKKEKFVALRDEAIQKILGNPPIEIREPRTLAEILESSQQALPVNLQTPLLQYTFDELRQIEDCEMQRLIDRLRMSRALLTKVIANPTLGVSYTLEEYNNSGCPLSDKGKKIKRMRFGTRRKLGDNDSYRYGHALKGITLYWLPVEFLP